MAIVEIRDHLPKNPCQNCGKEVIKKETRTIQRPDGTVLKNCCIYCGPELLKQLTNPMGVEDDN